MPNIPNHPDDAEAYIDLRENMSSSVYKGDILEPSNTELREKILKDHKEKALRYNQGKLKWSLIHYGSLVPLVLVLMFGAQKYAPDNWKKGLDLKEILESMQRHLAALMDGETYDPESKLHHIGHIACNMMFYAYHWAQQFGPKWKEEN